MKQYQINLKLRATLTCAAAVIGVAVIGIGSTPAARAQVQAGGPPPNRPDGRPTNRPPGGPPNIPAFDRDLAQSYIDKIEEGFNAVALNMGLFIRPGGTLSTDDAFALLQENVAKQAVGSKKWFLIQSVLGFGGYQTPNTADISNQAYAAIFDHAAKAPEVGASATVEQALMTYLNTVQSRHGLRRGDNSTSPEVLLKAFEAYLRLPQDPEAAQPLELKWEQALATIGGQEEFVAVVDKMLKEPGADQNYRLLRAAASAYDRFDPERAIELLQQARPIAPRQNPKMLQAFYDDLVRLMATNDQLPAAIAAQKELIQFTGEGNDQLLVLLDKADDGPAFDAFLASIMAPDHSEADLVNTASSLRKQARGGKRLWGASKQMLTEYLAGQRQRAPEFELHARVDLSVMLSDEGKYEEAKSVLTFDHLKPPFESRPAQRYYNEVEGLLEMLNQRLKNAA